MLHMFVTQKKMSFKIIKLSSLKTFNKISCCVVFHFFFETPFSRWSLQGFFLYYLFYVSFYFSLDYNFSFFFFSRRSAIEEDICYLEWSFHSTSFFNCFVLLHLLFLALYLLFSESFLFFFFKKYGDWTILRYTFRKRVYQSFS